MAFIDRPGYLSYFTHDNHSILLDPLAHGADGKITTTPAIFWLSLDEMIPPV